MKKPKEGKLTDKVDFRTTPQLHAELRTAANEDGRSVSSLVHRVLFEWMAQRIIAKARTQAE